MIEDAEGSTTSKARILALDHEKRRAFYVYQIRAMFHPMLHSPDTRDYEEARAATYDPPRDPQTPTSAPLVRALDTCKNTAKKIVKLL